MRIARPRSASPVDAIGDRLRAAMRHFATGVAIVTSRDERGAPAGTTVNGLTSLSLDPPLMLVCFARASNTLRALREHGSFAVNLLAADQEALGRDFARTGGRFAEVPHRVGRRGSPLLEGTLAWLECEVAEVLPGGDHEIVIGRVIDADVGVSTDQPLLFYGGSYRALPRPAASDGPVSALLPTRFGHFTALVSADEAILALVHGDVAGTADPLVILHRGCPPAELFGSLLCSCHDGLNEAIARITAAPAGMLLYARAQSGADLRCGRERPVDVRAVADALAELRGLGYDVGTVGELLAEVA